MFSENLSYQLLRFGGRQFISNSDHEGRTTIWIATEILDCALVDGGIWNLHVTAIKG